jgi:hypothetical protein
LILINTKSVCLICRPSDQFQNFILRMHQGRKTLLQKQHIIISS